MSNLLDTDFVSQGVKQIPNPWVQQWLQSAEQDSLFLSVVTLHEIRTGLDLMPMGKKRAILENWFALLVPAYQGRILEVTPEIALMSGSDMAKVKLNGHTAELGDCLIAATAKVHGLVLATLNRKHYSLLDVALVTWPD